MNHEIQDVFHPSDFTRGSEAAFCHALRIALAVRGRLEVFHVDEIGDGTHWTDYPSAAAYLQQWKCMPEGSGREAVAKLGLYIKKVQADGADPCAQILKYLDQHRPDLIVVATHQRRGLARWMHRAIAEPVARASAAWSLFVPRATRGFISPESGKARLANILIPADAHPAPQRAVEAAVALVQLLCGDGPVTFTMLFAGAPDDMPRARIPERKCWQMVEHCAEGKPEEVILDAVEALDIDLIVMATHGSRGFLDALRGSTTERVIRSAPCPVLAIPVGPWPPPQARQSRIP